MKVILVGDKPSRLNTHPDVPFVGAKCYSRLLSWIEYLKIKNYVIFNSHNSDWQQIIVMYHFLYPNDKFIALGKNAQKRLTKLGVKFFPMEHPSGLNRKLNDKKYIETKLKECSNYIKRK